MRLSIRHIILSLGVLYISTLCVGQTGFPDRQYRDSVYRHIEREGYAKQVCRFTYIQGSSEILPFLGNNYEEIARLDSFIHLIRNHTELRIRRIQLTGYCSVEGYYATNEKLARDRAAGFYRYIHSSYPALSHYPIDVAWVAEDWSGLYGLVKESKMNEWEEVLEIIRKIPIFDGRESLLMKLNGGRAYREMELTMFHKLRRVEMRVEYNDLPNLTNREVAQGMVKGNIISQDSTARYYRDMLATADPIEKTSNDDRPEPSLESEEYPKEEAETNTTLKPLFAIKTNLVPWIGILPDFEYTTPMANAALEYYITDKWSIEFGASYTYWKYNNDREFQGISGYRLEPRYRFNLSENLLAIYIGIYGRMGDYDLRRLESSADEETTNRTGRYWDTGISTGLYLRVIGNLGLEMGARVGYVRSNPTYYIRNYDNNWFDSRQAYRKFRLTDLNASLIYRFR